MTNRSAAPSSTVTATEHPAPVTGAAVPLKPVVTLKASGKIIPSDQAIIHTIALAFEVDDSTALEWLIGMFSKRAA